MHAEDGFIMATMGIRQPVGVTAGAFLPDIKGVTAGVRAVRSSSKA